MLEVLYRIYEVADEKTVKENLERDKEFSLYNSTSKAQNIELCVDCLICDSREQFKQIIKSMYGEEISFRYSKKLNVGALYCIIIGEHCYNTERYFNKVKFVCDCCGAEIETYYGRAIKFSEYEIFSDLYNIQGYAEKCFCSNTCKNAYKVNERSRIKPDATQEFYITKDMFISHVSGYIYKITKKTTNEFYVGQTQYVPVFRWGQHLKTERFPLENIQDYKFEVLEVVTKAENILEREKYWIQTCYKENPEKSLNIACVSDVENNVI